MPEGYIWNIFQSMPIGIYRNISETYIPYATGQISCNLPDNTLRPDRKRFNLKMKAACISETISTRRHTRTEHEQIA
jgi:type IV secretory pathway protease TraF